MKYNPVMFDDRADESPEVTKLQRKVVNLSLEVTRLRKKLAKKEDAEYFQSWKDNPDRMGGCFTKAEIEDSNGW